MTKNDYVTHYDFGTVDSKGRALGMAIHVWRENGVLWADAWATRSGQHFGASRNCKKFETLQQRMAWTQKRHAETKARYSKPGIR